MPRYLTKSRFKLALECATKLYYTQKKEYANQKNTDEFLLQLARGGMQIGELAKYYFTDDAAGITINTKPGEYDETIALTKARLAEGPGTLIAEAGFLHNNCYVRADVIEVREDGIHLYEVKAKSWSSVKSFTTLHGAPGSDWFEYLYDVAFQKWVIENATGLPVFPYLMLANKEVTAEIPGLARHFKVVQHEGRSQIIITPGLTRHMLGRELLIRLPIGAECRWIETNPVKTDLEKEYSFTDFIAFATEHYTEDRKIITPLGIKCKDCEFFTTPDESKAGFLSGKKQCWTTIGRLTEQQFEEEELVTELWAGNAGGGDGPVVKLFKENILLLRDGKRSIFDAKMEDGTGTIGNHQRRELQILKAGSGGSSPFILREELRSKMEEWVFPLHFIDFETSAMPIPWFANLRPYEGIAFQFSHHVMYEDGVVEHKNQYLSFEPGHFPNFDFVRALKNAVGDEGSIFRYHNHENNYLQTIRKQLISSEGIPDKEQLIEFIDSITQRKEKTGKKEKVYTGDRNMIDLYDLVLKYYYSPHAGGSNSLKQILPAAINDFPILKEKYGKPIYGKDASMPSLNYSVKTWILGSHDYDPYKTLEPVFENYKREELDRLVDDMKGLADGGTAMMAYNMLQYSEIPVGQREKIRDALFRYCELDTLAMVMLVEGLRSASNQEK